METDDLIFGKYEVIRRIAIGGMGEVFLARQTGVAGFDRLVILKSLLPELAEQEDFVEQFLDEARVAATLNHPNIVAIYEVGLWNGLYFIAMEHIHGDDLARLQKAAAKAKQGVPFQVSARIILDAALGLDHAHHATDMQNAALNIVHRDISPQNIMVRGDGVTKVVDFGIAKASNRSTRTATGMLKGKLQYMPPEQVRGEPVDGRSDQFALGAVLWELCTGRRLFKGENELETLEKVLKAPVPPPGSLVPGFPEHLEAVIMRMLARDADARYPRCKDAADDLRAYLDSCSRTVGETQVAEFVTNVLGEELNERTSNLVPSSDSNFLITFDGSGPNPASSSGEVAATPTTSRTYAELAVNRSRNVVAIAASISAAVVLASLVVVFLFLPGEAPPKMDGPPSTAEASAAAASKAPPPPAKKQRVGRLTKAKRGGTVLVIDEPVGAAVFINGKEWKQKVPTRVTGLSPGNHRVVVQPEVGAAIEESVEVKSAPAVFVVTSSPSGATVWAGGRQLGVTPLETDALLPGADHDVQVTLKGYEAQTITVKLKEGARETRDLRLKRRKRVARTGAASSASRETRIVEREKIVYRDRAAPTAKFGAVTIATKPWVKVSIDGQPYGSTPLFKIKLPAGKHKVRLVNEQAGVNTTRTITVKPDETLKRSWDLTKP